MYAGKTLKPGPGGRKARKVEREWAGPDIEDAEDASSRKEQWDEKRFELEEDSDGPFRS